MVSTGARRRMGCQEEEEKGVKRTRVLLREPCLVKMRNTFGALEKEMSVPATGLEKERMEGADAGSLAKDTVLVLGDGQGI